MGERGYEFHRVAGLFPMHSPADFDVLRRSIEAHGWDRTHPITLCEGKILDGRNRYKACCELGVEPTFVDFVGNPFEKLWLENGARRDLEPGQKAAIRAKANAASAEWQRQQDERRSEANRRRSETAKERPRAETATGTRFAPGPSPVSRDTALAEPDRARKHLARQVGVSEGTAGRVLTLQHKRPDLFEKVAAGSMTLADANSESKRAELTARLEDIRAREAKAVAGVYDVIVIDPPWPSAEQDAARKNGDLLQPGFNYPTMSLEDIEKLKVPFAEDCHIFMWTTQHFLPEAIRIVGAWGGRYTCTFVWKKPGGPQPLGLPQYNCEFVIYARVGSPKFIDTKDFRTCFDARRGVHSEKPAHFYDVLRRVTAGRRIDMFARRRHEGFEAWGNEVEPAEKKPARSA
jgi:N6-adenosine-specific RNA methylase IME4